jgi:hypothetical protein
MMPHQKNPKIIPNFFRIFSFMYEKRIHVKKMDKIFKSIIIIIMKNYQYFILMIFYFKQSLSIFLSLFCYRFIFKYQEMNLNFTF